MTTCVSADSIAFVQGINSTAHAPRKFAIGLGISCFHILYPRITELFILLLKAQGTWGTPESLSFVSAPKFRLSSYGQI